MDEYAAYVWVAYGITALLMGGLFSHAVYRLVQVKKLLSRITLVVQEVEKDES